VVEGPATASPVEYPYGLAVDAQDRVLVVSEGSRQVLRVADGAVSVVAGNGSATAPVEGPATASGMRPYGVAARADGTVLIGSDAGGASSDDDELAAHSPDLRPALLTGNGGGEAGQGTIYAAISRFSPASRIITFCSFSNARTSIWRTRSRDTP